MSDGPIDDHEVPPGTPADLLALANVARMHTYSTEHAFELARRYQAGERGTLSIRAIETEAGTA